MLEEENNDIRDSISQKENKGKSTLKTESRKVRFELLRKDGRLSCCVNFFIFIFVDFRATPMGVAKNGVSNAILQP